MKRYTISTKMQLLCLEMLEFVEDNPGATKEQIMDKFNTLPKPIVLLGYDLLWYDELLINDLSNTGVEVNPLHPYNTWLKHISALQLHPYGHEVQKFKKNAFFTHQYKLPPMNEITYREFTHLEYFKFKELYDYETMTLREGTGDMFFARQFVAQLADQTGEKRTHVYIAEGENHSILGFVSIPNYTSDTNLYHNLPLQNKNIFHVNFIATRPGAQNRGIATNLLRYAFNDISQKEDVKLLCYNPICDESAAVMKKVFNNSNYEIVDGHHELTKYYDFGMLAGYKIIPLENTSEQEQNEG